MVDKCKVPVKDRSISYIHGWNKACRHDSECLEYPDTYWGTMFMARGSTTHSMYARPNRKKKVSPRKPQKPSESLSTESTLPPTKTPTKPVTAKSRPPRRKDESTESKLNRARMIYEKKRR